MDMLNLQRWVAHFVTDRTKITPVFLSVGKYISTVSAAHVTFELARNFYEKMGLCVDLEDEILFSVFYHQNPYLWVLLFLIVVKKENLHFWWVTPVLSHIILTTAAAVLGKPFTCMSSPQKKKGVLKQKGERRNSLGEKRPKQTAATMRNFQHHQCWQLNTKPNKIRICYY